MQPMYLITEKPEIISFPDVNNMCPILLSVTSPTLKPKKTEKSLVPL